MNAQSPQEYFQMMLITVVGQAFDAAGYHLAQRPMQWAGGLFRFVKPLDDLFGIIDFQVLAYPDGQPSRFQVILMRSTDANGGNVTTDPRCVRVTLAALVVDGFGVGILPSAAHWWMYHNTTELGYALGEAGSLAVGYGMPFLSGELAPPRPF